MNLRGKVVLVADEDPATRDAGAEILRNAGAETLVASDLEGVAGAVRRGCPHLVFAGRELAGQLALEPALQGVPVLTLEGPSNAPLTANQLLRRARRFLRHMDAAEVVPASPWTATAELPCAVVAAGSGGIVIESGLRASAGACVRLSVPELFGPIGIDGPFPVRAENALPSPDSPGFRCELRLRGLTGEQRQILEEVIARWHT